MYRFNVALSTGARLNDINLNTTHVSVQLALSTGARLNDINLNTTHVSVQW